MNDQSYTRKESYTKKKHLTVRAVAACLVGGIFILLLLTDPDGSIDYMTRGLRLCVTSVIPTLFPFMVISGILTRSGCGRLLGIVMGRPLRRLFGVSGAGAAAVLLGAVCGFPVGAVTVASMYDRGELDRDEAAHVLSFCNFPSSAFMVTAIGVTLFGNKRIGMILMISVYLAGAVCGIVNARLLRRRTGQRTDIEPSPTSASVVIAGEAITQAVMSAAESMLYVCAYVAFFSSVTGCLGRMINGISHSATLDALLYSFFELTSGAAAAASLNDPVTAILICAAAAGWSGLSVHLQVISSVSAVGKERSGGIPVMPYIVSKAIQSLLALLICRFLLFFTPTELIRLPEADAVTALSALLAFPSLTQMETLFSNSLFVVSAMILFIKKLDR